MKKLQKNLGYQFAQPELLIQALTHRSFPLSENPEIPSNNEVLEFLGDAVLDLALGHYLIQNNPLDSEGNLSKKRSKLVNETVLAEMALELDLQDLLFMGKGEEKSGGRNKPRLLASALEAVIGALFMESSYDKAAEVVTRLFASRLQGEELFTVDQRDYKSLFQEFIQQRDKLTPDYKVISESGPDHEKVFSVEVSVKGVVMGTGVGRNKKQAEQQAAQEALHRVEQEPDDEAL